MSIISKSLFIIFTLQLLHSAFSSFEFHQLTKQQVSHGELRTSINLPVDIKIEVLVALTLFTIGVMMSFDKLQYLTLSGPRRIVSQDQYLQELPMNAATKKDNLIGNDPHGAFTYMPSLVNIHGYRKYMKEHLLNKKE